MKFIASLTLAALAVAGFAQVASAQQQKTYTINVSKDSTILRAPGACSSCPEGDCNRCTRGGESTLDVQAGLRVLSTAILGFTLPSEATQAPDRLDNCQLLLPNSLTSLQQPLTLNIFSADPFWDEYSVTANNAPAYGSQIGQVTVPVWNGMPAAVDLTAACKAAAAKGTGFTVYLTPPGTGYVQFPSKEAGRPAALRATVH
ncbi:hypothetical protein H4219_005915 [Mycoemilia scoparia]|uniref:Carbohydrate-binding module family 96 domain-containing protein n=1 Tax=Mycoemilia scoparia TaxID=417184 RepID=A0A9W8DP32_9FUNG|nr:hypothetical protein H4219_005915 [Mycoemilia scoparia]